MNNIVYKAIRRSIANSVCGSVKNSILDSVWGPAGSVHGSYVRNSIGMALKISVQQSVEDYFYTNSDKIKQ
jgi:hypothetical protein